MSLYTYLEKNWAEMREHYGYYYLLTVISVVFGLLMLYRLTRKKLKLPPGPVGLPLLGYLPLLGEEPFKTLDKLRKKYGNVFSLYLGQTYVVVLGDYAAVKEAFSKNSTAHRPPGIFDFIPDGGGIAGINGPEWVEQRRFVVRTMKDIGLGRSTWARMVEEEVSDFLKLLSSKKGQAVDIADLISYSITNSISSLVFGERLPPGNDRDLLHDKIETIMLFFSASGIWNFFPWLCNILVKLRIGNFYKSYSEMVALNEVIRRQVKMHTKSESNLEGANFIHDYLAAMPSNQEKEKGFTDRNLVGNTRALYIGGTDTTKTALSWLFVTMATYPDVQKRVQSELDSVLGKHQRATWEDRLKFPYTYAVTLETQRWKTIVPLNVLRMAADDTKVCGYDIPKGATIMANIWGLHNDTKYWKEPEKFIAERFLMDGKNEVDLKKESYVPFSYGKRKCPGETVALMAAFLYFTSIMQLYDVKVPSGGKPKTDGKLGITYQPVPQEFCFTPRKSNPDNV